MKKFNIALGIIIFVGVAALLFIMKQLSLPLSGDHNTALPPPPVVRPSSESPSVSQASNTYENDRLDQAFQDLENVR